MSDFFGFLIMLCISFAIVSIPLGCANYVFEEKTCEAQWESSGKQWKYSLFGNCQIRLENGDWIPASSYRSVNEEKK